MLALFARCEDSQLLRRHFGNISMEAFDGLIALDCQGSRLAAAPAPLLRRIPNTSFMRGKPASNFPH